MCSVLNHQKIMFFGNLTDFVQFTRLSGIIHRYDCFGFFCYFSSDIFWIYVISIRFYISKHRYPSAIQHTVRRCRKGYWRSNHFIPRLDSCRKARCMECRCPVCDCYGIFRSSIITYCLFKFRYLRSGCKEISTQNLYNCLNIIFIYHLSSVCYHIVTSFLAYFF